MAFGGCDSKLKDYIREETSEEAVVRSEIVVPPRIDYIGNTRDSLVSVLCIEAIV